MSNTKVYSAEVKLELQGIKEVLVDIKKLQTELNSVVKDIKKAFTTRIDSAPVREFSQSVSQSTEKVKAHAEAVKQMAEADKEAANAKKKSQEATANFNEAMRRFDTQISKSDSRTDVAGVEGITQGIATAKQGLFEIKAQLKTGISFESLYGVYDTVNKTLAQVNQSTNQVRMGLNIAFADAGKDVNKFGQAAEGLKVALFGVDTAGKQYSGTLGWIKKGLEAVSASTISLSRNTNTLGADAVETARKMADLNNRLGAGFDNLKNAMQDAGITRMGVQMGRLKEIANQTAAEFSNLASNISSGKKIDTGVLKSYERGVIELQRSLKQLDDLGVIPTTKALKDLEHQMETTADDELKAELAQQLAKMKQLKAAYDETKTVIQSNSEGVRALNIQVKAYTQGSEGFVSRLKQMWSGSSKDTDVAKKGIKGVTDVLYSGETSADGMTKKVGLLGGALQGASKSASIFKDVMLGTFAGNLLSNAIGGITGMISNVVSRITGFGSNLAGEFFQANRQVQDFDTTLRQMMTGFDPDVIKKSMQATNEFIRKIIATTPFELATGQQAFQQLATAGFDPRGWLKESADAAAAFNKPMEQLIFAMQRLKAGSKGMGVDMLRDFGIPVQQVGVWTNQASGKVAEFNEVAGKTEEELKASGYAFKKWEFEASGALKQTPTEALNILNGYFRQNAVVVDASAARSKTLTGVLSNLKDTFTTLLTAFGQPIFKVVTQVLTDVYDVIASLMDVLQPFAQLIGEQVAAAFQGWWSALTGIQPVIEGVSEKAKELAEAVRSERIKQIGAAIMQYLKPALFAIMAIMKGDWSKAWGLFYQLAVKAVKGIGTFLQTTGKDALKWGANFVGMIAKGLVTAASTTLKFAIKSVATTISNFMKPGSPPREGPLSTIDKWGQGLIKTFGEGFSSADFSFMQDVLSPVKDMFLSMGKTDAYKQVRGMVGSLIQGINETGTLNEQIWAGVEAKLGSTNKELAAYIRAELQLKQVSAEYQKAEKNGFISKELQDRVDAAQTLVALRKEDLELANQAKQGSGAAAGGGESTQNLKADLDKQKKIAENEYKAGITTKAEYYAKLAELDKSYAQQLAEQGDIKGAKKANEQSKQEQKKTLKESFDEEKKFLEQKKKVGLVTEEEYLSELQGLNKKYGEEALKAGDTGMAQELSNKAKDLEKQIQKARLEEQRKQLDAQVKQEREILEKKYAAGLISEEEYRQGLVQIQENYVNQLMQAGAGPAVLDKEISKLKAMKEELKAFQTPKQDNIQTILGDMANDVTGEFDKMLESLKGEFDSAATSTWENVKQTFFDTFTPIWNDITASISESLGGLGVESGGGIMGGIKAGLTSLWSWFTGPDGPLAQGSELFSSITASLEAWRTDVSNMATIENLGKWVGETLVNGVGVALTSDTTKNTVINKFNEALSGLALAIPSLVNSVVAAFTSGLFAPAGENVAKGIGQGLADGLIPLGSSTVKTVLGFFTDNLTKVDWLSIVNPIYGAFKWLYDVLVGHSIIPDLVKDVLWWFSNMSGNLKKWLDDLNSGFLDAFATALNGVTLGGWDWLDFFGIDAYSSTMALLKTKLLEGLADLGRALYEFAQEKVVQNIAKRVLQSLGILEKPAKSLGAKLIGLIGEGLEAALPTLLKYGPKVVGTIIDIAPTVAKITGFVGRLIPPLTLIMSLWQNLDRFVTSRVDGMVQAVISMGTAIIDTVNSLGLGANGVLSYIMGDTATAKQQLSEAVSGIMSGMVEFGASVTNFILELGGGIGQLLISDTVGMIGTVYQWLGDTLNNYNLKMAGLLLSNVDLAFGQLVTRAKEILMGLKDQVLTIIELTKNDSTLAWKAFTDAVVMTINDSIALIKQPFTDLYDWLVGNSLIPDLVTAIVDILGTLPDRLAELDLGNSLISVFDGVGDSMLESGRSLVDNFINGVKEVLPGLQSFMETEVAGYSISDFFPNSPAKRGPLSVLPNWQYYMTEGLEPAVQAVNQTLVQVSNSIVQTTQQAAQAIQETTATMQDSIAMATSTYPSAGEQPSGGGSSKKKKNGLSYGYSDKYSKENQGSGFGNYGKGQDGPGWTKQKGGLTNAWKNFFNSYKGKTPQYAKGSFKIATTHTAVVHKGEAVLPAPVADSMRKAFEKTGGKGLSGLSIGSAVFPNVRDGRDAQDFLNELNKRVHRAKLRGSTV